MDMRKLIVFAVFSWLGLLVSEAQTFPASYPMVDNAMAMFVNHDGEDEQIEKDGVYDAPIMVTFMAYPIDESPTDTIGYDILYEWNITQVKNGMERLLAKRNEETTTFTFTEGGNDVSYRIVLYITYIHRDSGVEGEGESEPITFSLRGSSVHLYNAFSPNGDGTNDVYRVKTQSLLSFRMKIFNRWGQEIVSGDHNTLPSEHENDFTYYVCWDGMYHGNRVEDGVYFILVEAEGSDGVKYVRRGDINLLTRLRREEKK